MMTTTRFRFLFPFGIIAVGFLFLSVAQAFSPYQQSLWRTKPASFATSVAKQQQGRFSCLSPPSWRLHQSSSVSTTSTTTPRISNQDLEQLATKGYVVIDNFISEQLQEALRQDVANLRSNNEFRIAKIGQDATNTLNQDIRVAETCFLGPSKLQNFPDSARNQLYTVLDQVQNELSANAILQQAGFAPALDSNLSELLYAYYPKGGFYRRHVDAIPGSASVLRSWSLLLYLNKDWTPDQGGELLIHSDGGRDFLPEGATPNYITVQPKGGTLVLFKSDLVPHEVLDTKAERVAVVGWYNRAVSAADIASLSGDGGKTQVLLLVVAAALVTVGVVSLLSQ